jgi:4-alpha-glucanotransferase
VLFRIDQRVGTPPDGASETGQDWGLPVYDWEAFKDDDFAWIKARAMRAGQLYSLYRVDHALGFYRTYFRSTDGKQSGFTPADERGQMALGERIMRIMSRWGEVVAEDLGAVPPFLRPSLDKIGVPGYRVLRWEQEEERFRDPASWPAHSVATNATHDTETTADWFDGLTLEEREKLKRVPGLGDLDIGAPFSQRTGDLILRVLYRSPSTLALTLFQDALGERERINTPGSVGGTNWRFRAPKNADELLADSATTERLAALAKETGRAPAKRS